MKQKILPMITLFTLTSLFPLEACTVKDLQKEINTLKKRIELLENGQNTNSAKIKNNSEKIDIIECKQKIFSEKNELEHIFTKYENNSDKLTPFHYAIKVGDLDAVTILLNEKCAGIYSVDYMDGFEPKSKKITPLVRAALWNQYEIAKLLIELGADVNVSSVNNVMKPMPGITALQYARTYGSEELISLLIEHGGI